MKLNELLQASIFAPVARIMLALIFVIAGFNKISGYEGTQGYMSAMGVMPELLPAVIFVEIVAGLMLMVGFCTRLAAVSLAGFTLLAGFLFHFNLADQMQYILFMKNIAITGGLLMVAHMGAGAWSIDAKRDMA
ncbi:DoxX family protein [Thiomicrorhabdus sediminis]|uniref:DoxX family protein n=1 Tax=Thiomicrorhabdus sediminis TaxID=2580412 RepID=UPI001931145A|nr:DoxX family protein [Thiomicrorhabdus sediminis]